MLKEPVKIPADSFIIEVENLIHNL